ncbi:MAG: M23 family metallopeptidase [Azonexus sp.]|nr:M23 family metallopeptidase [Azonexus sp.]
MPAYNPGNGFTQTSKAGQRVDPITGEVNSTHRGDDWAAPAGTDIPAADGGVVEFSGWMSGYGNTVVIRNS